MLNGDKNTDCTLHRVDEGIDTGLVAGMKSMAVDYSKSVLWHMCKLYPLVGIDLFKDLLLSYKNGQNIETEIQTEDKKRYYTFPNEEEFSRFSAVGYDLINNGNIWISSTSSVSSLLFTCHTHHQFFIKAHRISIKKNSYHINLHFSGGKVFDK